MLYLHLALEQFTCNKKKIFWTLAFFKDEHATKWSENLFRQEADTSIFLIRFRTDFKQQFQSQFFPVNAEADAINTLEGSSYYQGNQMVDDYLDSFLILASDARYMDPWTLVVKFHCGLKLNIQSQIATMPFGRPADMDPEAWYTAAQRIDQARLANEVFQSTLQSMTVTSACFAPVRPTPFFVLCSSPAALPSVLPRPPLPSPTPSSGIPMDVDTVWKTCSLPLQGCYQCREANHLVKNYPHCLDVQRLTAKQREELIEDLMALKDAVEEEEVCLAPEEGFV